MDITLFSLIYHQLSKIEESEDTGVEGRTTKFSKKRS